MRSFPPRGIWKDSMRGLCTYAALLPGPPTIPINFSICQVPVRYQYVLESSEEYRVKLWTQRDTSDLKWYPWSHLKLFLVTGKDETALITTNSDPRKKKKKKKSALTPGFWGGNWFSEQDLKLTMDKSYHSHSWSSLVTLKPQWDH